MKNKEFKSFVNTLRSSDTEQLIDEYGSEHFSDDGIPVVIAARNEQDNIAQALASLAENARRDGARVRPIVVENGSDENDRTAEIARRMGAVVLHSEAFKLAALQEGVRFLQSEGKLDQPVLFTDADSIVGPTWVNTMSQAAAGDQLTVVGGRSTLDHGPSKISDMVGRLALRFDDMARKLGKQPVAARGDNTALNFANNQEAIDWYLGQDSRRMVYEDDAIGLEFVARGAKFVRMLGHDAVVSSLGDRYVSLKERLRIVRKGGDEWLFKKYEEEYPGIIFGKYDADK